MDRDDERRSDPESRNETPRDAADRDYGFSGRGGYSEGSYSGAYGRGSAGEHEGASPSGNPGAGYARGGSDLPRPDALGGPEEDAADGQDRRDGEA